MAEEKIVRWKVIDPRGIEITLYDKTFIIHVRAEHNDRDSAFRAAIEPNVKKTLEHPTLILPDPDIKNRFQYYRADLVGLEDQLKKVKTVKVVIEPDSETSAWKVVTWGAQNRLQGVFRKEDIVYES